MTNKSNTGNSQHAIRKSCAFAFGVALLSTLLFASAAHAQSNCFYSQTFGRFAYTCPTSNTTGKVWVSFSGTWTLQENYTVGPIWIYIYHYGPKLWTAESRVTGQVFVRNTAGTWITYATYNATNALSALTTLLQSQTQGSAPTFTIVPFDWRGEYCRNVRFFQQYYTNLGYPWVTGDPLCG